MLRSLNTRFMGGAEKYRFIRLGKNEKQVFTNYPRADFTPYNTTFLRSIRFVKSNIYIFAMDLDAESFTRDILAEGKKICQYIQRNLSINPVLKFSGNKGVQPWFYIKFPEGSEETYCLKYMRDLAYTIYSNTPNINANIGHPTQNPEPPFFDMCMYDSGRMIRSYSIHLKSRMASIPIEPDDEFDDVIRKASKDYDEVEWIQPGVLYPLQEHIINEWSKTGDGRSAVDIEMLEAVREQPFKKDSVYMALPSRLRAVVDLGRECPHDYKWALEAHLRAVCGLSTEEVIDWVFANCDWDDLRDVANAKKNIMYTVSKADKLAQSGILMTPYTFYQGAEFPKAMRRLKENYGMEDKRH